MGSHIFSRKSLLTHSRHKTTAKNTSTATMQGTSARLRNAMKSSVVMQRSETRSTQPGAASTIRFAQSVKAIFVSLGRLDANP